MQKSNKISCFNFRNFLISTICSFFVMVAFWLLCAGLQKLGCPFPNIHIDKFSDLGFFALSNFSFITFLALIPFQTAEGQLSPGFFAKIINRPWSHFGLYVLLSSFVACFLILSYENKIPVSIHGQFFMAIVGAVIFAIIFHLSHTLRYLYQPLIVYENLTKLANEESSEELWLDLYECTLKAIKAQRVGNANSFIDLMGNVYTKMDERIKITNLQRDVRSLYEAALDIPPITAQMEKNWTFLRMEGKNHKQPLKEPLAATLARITN